MGIKKKKDYWLFNGGSSTGSEQDETLEYFFLVPQKETFLSGTPGHKPMNGMCAILKNAKCAHSLSFLFLFC